MSTAVLVSDIHIDAPDGVRCAQFSRLLEALYDEADLSEVYLLGDIFDLWVADHDYFVRRYAAIVERLAALRARGVEIAYFEGNHDLYLRHFWERELGFTIYGGPVYRTIAGRTVRLEHGDQMNPDDRGYLFLRWFLRTPPVHFLCRRLPGWLIARIGDKASATSRRYSSDERSTTSEKVIDIIRTHARKAFASRPFDLIVSGHVHTRDDWECVIDGRSFRSINLGSWYDAPCLFRIGENEARFVELSEIESASTSSDAVERAIGVS